MKHPEHTFTEQEVLTILRNMGHDVECGACMAIAFTGLGFPGDEHTCKAKKEESLDEAERLKRTLRILAEHEPSWSDDFLRARAALKERE